jgi:hypothetical protein
VREEFAREVIIPSARDAGPAGVGQNATFATLAAAFVDRRLQSIASLEEGRAIRPTSIPFHRDVDARPLALGPALLRIRFEKGIPVAINGIRMTLTELFESVETISGRSALEILSLAYRELAGIEGDEVTFDVKGACGTIATAAACVE